MRASLNLLCSLLRSLAGYSSTPVGTGTREHMSERANSFSRAGWITSQIRATTETQPMLTSESL
ncbi:Uncharacterised protein [Mycobacteroides abscessus subsp. abscessus]|nr:Uncharacterised protein [Mycobacteroides abscessus subsp. abscessus]